MRRTSQLSGIGSRRACTYIFLFTHAYLYCRSLLRVSFHVSYLGAEWEHFLSHMYVSFRTFMSLLQVSFTDFFDACVIPRGAVGAFPVTHVRLFSHIYISFAGLFYGFLSTHVSYLGAEWEHLQSHTYISSRTCMSLLQVSFIDFFRRMCRTSGRSVSVSLHT